jgi:hypothetical protein
MYRRNEVVAFGPGAAFACACVWFFGSDAHAAEAHRFSFSSEALPGAESCAASGLPRAVEDRLGRKVFDSPAAADLRIGARVERSGEPAIWRATISLLDRGGLLVGSRELQSEASDCADLHDSLVLAVALMIDLEAPESPHPSSPPSAQPDVEPHRSSPAPAAASWRVDVELSAVAASGLLPTMPFGGAVRARVAFDDFWSAEAYSLGFLPATAAADRGASADFSLVLGGLAGCRLAFRSGGGNRFDLCTGFEAGAIGVQGHGFDASSPHTSGVIDAVVQGSLLAPLGSRVALRLGAALDIPLVRTRFQYTDAGTKQELYQRPPVAETGELGLVVMLR